MPFYENEIITNIPEKISMKIKKMQKLSEMSEQYRPFLEEWLSEGMPFDNIIDIFELNEISESKYCIAWFHEKIMILFEQECDMKQIVLSSKDIIGLDYFSNDMTCQISIKYLKEYALATENIQYDKISEKLIEPIFHIILGISVEEKSLNNADKDCDGLKQVTPQIYQCAKLCYRMDKKILDFYWSIKYGNKNKYTKQYFIGVMNKGIVLIDWSIQNIRVVYIFWDNIENISYEVNKKKNYVLIKTDLGRNYLIPISDKPFVCPFCFIRKMETYLLTYGAI